MTLSANRLMPGGSTTASWNATSAFADSLQQCYGYNGLSGKLAASGAYTGTDWASTGNLQIGRGIVVTGYSQYANGSISDVHTYNTALPVADAANNNDNNQLTQLG